MKRRANKLRSELLDLYRKTPTPESTQWVVKNLFINISSLPHDLFNAASTVIRSHSTFPEVSAAIPKALMRSSAATEQLLLKVAHHWTAAPELFGKELAGAAISMTLADKHCDIKPTIGTSNNSSPADFKFKFMISTHPNAADAFVRTVALTLAGKPKSTMPLKFKGDAKSVAHKIALATMAASIKPDHITRDTALFVYPLMARLVTSQGDLGTSVLQLVGKCVSRMEIVPEGVITSLARTALNGKDTHAIPALFALVSILDNMNPTEAFLPSDIIELVQMASEVSPDAIISAKTRIQGFTSIAILSRIPDDASFGTSSQVWRECHLAGLMRGAWIESLPLGSVDYAAGAAAVVTGLLRFIEDPTAKGSKLILELVTKLAVWNLPGLDLSDFVSFHLHGWVSSLASPFQAEEAAGEEAAAVAAAADAETDASASPAAGSLDSPSLALTAAHQRSKLLLAAADALFKAITGDAPATQSQFSADSAICTLQAFAHAIIPEAAPEASFRLVSAACCVRLHPTSGAGKRHHRAAFKAVLRALGGSPDPAVLLPQALSAVKVLCKEGYCSPGLSQMGRDACHACLGHVMKVFASGDESVASTEMVIISELISSVASSVQLQECNNLTDRQVRVATVKRGVLAVDVAVKESSSQHHKEDDLDRERRQKAEQEALDALRDQRLQKEEEERVGIMRLIDDVEFILDSTADIIVHCCSHVLSQRASDIAMTIIAPLFRPRIPQLTNVASRALVFLMGKENPIYSAAWILARMESGLKTITWSPMHSQYSRGNRKDPVAVSSMCPDNMPKTGDLSTQDLTENFILELNDKLTCEIASGKKASIFGFCLPTIRALLKSPDKTLVPEPMRAKIIEVVRFAYNQIGKPLNLSLPHPYILGCILAHHLEDPSANRAATETIREICALVPSELVSADTLSILTQALVNTSPSVRKAAALGVCALRGCCGTVTWGDDTATASAAAAASAAACSLPSEIRSLLYLAEHDEDIPTESRERIRDFATSSVDRNGLFAAFEEPAELYMSMIAESEDWKAKLAATTLKNLVLNALSSGAGRTATDFDFKASSALNPVQFVAKILLQKHLDISPSREEFLYDKRGSQRAHVMGAIADLAELVCAHNSEIMLPKSIILPAFVKTMPQGLSPHQIEDELARRTAERAVSHRGEIASLTLSRVMEYGVRDPSTKARLAAVAAAKATVKAFGLRFQGKIRYLRESGRHFKQIKPDKDILALQQQLVDWLELFADPKRQSGQLEEDDTARAHVITILTELTSYMPENDPSRKSVLEAIENGLQLPSEHVQREISHALSRILAGSYNRRFAVRELMPRYLEWIDTSDSYAKQRGGAFALAGVAKSLGLSALTKKGILDSLETRFSNKDASVRECALFCFEAMMELFGQTFEPYLIIVVRHVLDLVSDSSTTTREAAETVTRTLMKSLTPYGVSYILPPLVSALGSSKWRTKLGATNMLGMMAFCSRTALASALPRIVPELQALLHDPHPKVSSAAKKAVSRVAGVIRAPELRRELPVLVEALAKPSMTHKALNSISKVQFKTRLDSPALSLLIPVAIRGLGQSRLQTKLAACEVISSLSRLTDSQDLSRYSSSLVPPLRTGLLDALPEVRAAASGALATVTRSLPRDCDEVAQIMDSLWLGISKPGGISEAHGCAQALAEVSAALGPDVVKSTFARVPGGLNEDLSRQGHLLVLLYLPRSISRQSFADLYLDDSLQLCVDVAADIDTHIRKSVLKIGRVLVTTFQDDSDELTLVTRRLLEGSQSSSAPRRRFCLELLGDNLAALASMDVKELEKEGDKGASKKALRELILQIESEVETVEGAVLPDSATETLVSRLGSNLYGQIMARIFISRVDPNVEVRHTAVLIWKAIVTRSMLVVRSIFPELLQQLVKLMGRDDDNGFSPSKLGADVVVEIASKMATRFLADLIDHFSTISVSEDHLRYTERDRAAAVLGMSAIARGTRKMSPEQIDVMSANIGDFLGSPSHHISTAGAKLFAQMSKHGSGLNAQILVPILEKAATGEEAQNALVSIVQSKPTILAFIVQHLCSGSDYVSDSNSRVLGAVARAAPRDISVHVSDILEALWYSIDLDSPLFDGTSLGPRPTLDKAIALSPQLAAICSLISSAGQYDFRAVSKFPFSAMRKEGEREKSVSLLMIAALLRLDGIKDSAGQVIMPIMSLFTSPSKHIQTGLSIVLPLMSSELLKKHPDVAAEFISAIRGSLDVSKHRALPCLAIPGFALPLITHFTSLFSTRATSGVHDTAREDAVFALMSLLRGLPPAQYRACFTPAMGKAILSLAERHQPGTRAALIKLISYMLSVHGKGLAMFVLPLSGALVDRRGLINPSAEVRRAASDAIQQLATVTPKKEDLIYMMYCQLLQSEVSNAMLASIMDACSSVIALVWEGLPVTGSKVRSRPGQPMVVETTLLLQISKHVSAAHLYDLNPETRAAAAKLVAACLVFTADTTIATRETVVVCFAPADSKPAKHGQTATIDAMLEFGGERGYELLSTASGLDPELPQKLLTRLTVRLSAAEGRELHSLLAASCRLPTLVKQPMLVWPLLQEVTRVCTDAKEASDRIAAITSVRNLSTSAEPWLNEQLAIGAAGSILSSLRDKQPAVRVEGEKCLVELLRLRNGDDLALKIIEALRKRKPGRADQLAVQVQMLVRRIRSGRM
eukprot:gnl/Dysnectes_brevis/1486_a1682_1648.p1 GENE.gnl/Dysnectes_brevis/1486_a1682_1648~~gnl/Dysnectes_brevis/1486_a1682_1648.p1  ORF type:complete len:2683 (-),score=751.64 gnl/Dysnectes_brevis/1486_a1682_1648:77-8125(-)